MTTKKNEGNAGITDHKIALIKKRFLALKLLGTNKKKILGQVRKMLQTSQMYVLDFSVDNKHRITAVESGYKTAKNFVRKAAAKRAPVTIKSLNEPLRIAMIPINRCKQAQE